MKMLLLGAVLASIGWYSVNYTKALIPESIASSAPTRDESVQVFQFWSHGD